MLSGMQGKKFKVTDMWSVLEQAAQDHRKCYIRYKRRGSHKKRGSHKTVYLIAPYSFRNKPGGEVLFAYDYGSRRIKSFFKDGVTGVRVAPKKFRPKWDVEMENVMPEIFESFYQLAALNKVQDMDSFMSQGRAAERGITEADVDPDELKRGIEVEMEHTNDPDMAKKIALDHLAEFDRYYTGLDKMEAQLSAEESQ